MLNSVVYWDIHAARLIIIISILASGAPQPERKTPIQKMCPYNQSWSPGLGWVKCTMHCTVCIMIKLVCNWRADRRCKMERKKERKKEELGFVNAALKNVDMLPSHGDAS